MAKPTRKREFDWEKERRIAYAESLLARQYTGRVILARLVEKYDVDLRTAYTYVGVAFDRLAADAESDRPIRKARMRLTLQSMLRAHMARNDGSAANRAADMLCKIDGLYTPEKITVEHTVGVPMEIEQVVGVLDGEGLKALELVLAQVERAGLKALPDASAPDPNAPVAAPGMPSLPSVLTEDDEKLLAADKPRRRRSPLVIDADSKP